jgi:5-methyltetrahydropteroyltriglutamate--homocysteine methyltransferase
MHAEYAAIVEAGLVLQIDDPWLTALYHDDPYGFGPEHHIDLLNFALRGIPPAQVRYHTCYGINEGPRVHDVPLGDIVHLLLRIDARLVGRENLIAGADCGFSSTATFAPEVDPKVVWAKFQAVAEGARRASNRLW